MRGVDVVETKANFTFSCHTDGRSVFGRAELLRGGRKRCFDVMQCRFM